MHYNPGYMDKLAETARKWSGTLFADNPVLKTLLDAMPIVCYVLLPDHTVVYWNPEAKKILGFSAKEMRGKKCVDMPLGCSFTSGTHISGGSCPAVVAYATGKPKTMQMFMRNKNGKDILLRNTLVPLKDASGKVNVLISFFVPLADNNYSQSVIQSIYETATRDSLTCLPSRKYMEICLNESLELFHRTGQLFAVLFTDVNNFHDINNTYGHATGDAILREVGFALRRYGRKADRFCRWGGDEFVGLLQLRQANEIEGAARRFLAVANDCDIVENGQKISCRVAIGITVVRERDTISSLVARADRYMYEAKQLRSDPIVTDFSVHDKK